MGLSNALGAAAHDAMHRLPGMPDHSRKAQLNAHQHQRALRNRPLRHRPLQSAHSHHGRPPRLFPGWQAWLGQRFRQSQR